MAMMIVKSHLLIAILVLLASLLAHELGHMLMAQRLGLHVEEIIITPLGGMASIEDLSSRPLDEVRVAAAGPLTNIVIAGIALLFSAQLASIIVFINLGLGFGNLLPIFPLDGGRILRGLFSASSNPVDAINCTGKVSKYLCIVLILLGFKYGFTWFAIALIIYSVYSYKRELLSQIFSTGVSPSISLDKMIGLSYRFLLKKDTPSAADHDQSLENFGGSLEEYFDDKK